MAFKATLNLGNLANSLGTQIPNFLTLFASNFGHMVDTCDTADLEIDSSGNCFKLKTPNNPNYQPPNEQGLYCIFSRLCYIYVGEAESLCDRILTQKDHTDEQQVISGNTRQLLKYTLHNNYLSAIGIGRLAVQVYPGSCIMGDKVTSLDNRYNLNKYRKSLEGLVKLIGGQYHHRMLCKANADGIVL
jgi:hypothetical protein